MQRKKNRRKRKQEQAQAQKAQQPITVFNKEFEEDVVQEERRICRSELAYRSDSEGRQVSHKKPLNSQTYKDEFDWGPNNQDIID